MPLFAPVTKYTFDDDKDIVVVKTDRQERKMRQTRMRRQTTEDTARATTLYASDAKTNHTPETTLHEPCS